MIEGRRRDYDDNSIPNAGEYGKGEDGRWYCVPPNEPDLIGNLSNHTVTEHEDGTITVSPSILITLKHKGLEWHGYIVRGVWREV
jgi:hypothetical protein